MGHVFIFLFLALYRHIRTLLHLLRSRRRRAGQTNAFAGGLIALPTIPLLAVLPGIPF